MADGAQNRIFCWSYCRDWQGPPGLHLFILLLSAALTAPHHWPRPAFQVAAAALRLDPGLGFDRPRPAPARALALVHTHPRVHRIVPDGIYSLAVSRGQSVRV